MSRRHHRTRISDSANPQPIPSPPPISTQSRRDLISIVVGIGAAGLVVILAWGLINWLTVASNSPENMKTQDKPTITIEDPGQDAGPGTQSGSLLQGSSDQASQEIASDSLQQPSNGETPSNLSGAGLFNQTEYGPLEIMVEEATDSNATVIVE